MTDWKASPWRQKPNPPPKNTNKTPHTSGAGKKGFLFRYGNYVPSLKANAVREKKHNIRWTKGKQNTTNEFSFIFERNGGKKVTEDGSSANEPERA